MSPGDTSNVLVVSNQPYALRQGIGAEREVKKALASAGMSPNAVKVHPVGFGLKQNVTTVRSEVGALVAEWWKNANGSRDKCSFYVSNKRC